MKITYGILGIGVIFTCLLVYPACTSTTPTTATPRTTTSSTGTIIPNPSAYTVSLSSVNIGEFMQFDMSLQDSDGNNVTPDGHMSIKIYDEANPPILVYQKELDITSSQFINYTGGGQSSYYLTLYPPIKVFEWSSPLTDFITSTHMPSFLRTRGDAHLTFTTKDGKTFTRDSYVLDIPYAPAPTQ